LKTLLPRTANGVRYLRVGGRR